jgi:hypothetical protein
MGLTALAITAAKGRDKQYNLADYGSMRLLIFRLGSGTGG